MLPIKIISKFCKPGKFGQWIAVMIVSLCGIPVALGLAWVSGALPKIRRGEAGFILDMNEQSWIASSISVGNIISPIPSAYIMDHLGRRNSLCLTIWLHVFSFVIVATTKGFWALCIARIMSGLWLGLVYTVVPVYIGECADPNVRGVLGTYYGTFIYVGSLIVSVIGWYFSYVNLAWFSVIFTGSLAVILCFIPESPYYYLMKNDIEAARSSLTWLRGSCNETVLQAIQDSIQKNKNSQSSFLEIFKRHSAFKGFLMIVILGTVQRSAGLSILINFTSVTMPTYIITPEEFTIVLNIVWIVSCLLSGFVVDKFGRRTLIAFSSTGSGLTMFGVGVWFYLREKTSVDVSSLIWLPFVLLIIHGIAFSFGLVSIPTMLSGEIFSPDIKSKASSLYSIWLALVSGIVINIYIPLEVGLGVYVNFLICAIFSFIGVLTALFYMIETRGRTIEENIDQLEGNSTKTQVIESTRF